MSRTTRPTASKVKFVARSWSETCFPECDALSRCWRKRKALSMMDGEQAQEMLRSITWVEAFPKRFPAFVLLTYFDNISIDLHLTHVS